jgi:hypothetical protein
MDKNEYLKQVLESQTLADDSPELKELRGHREAVETLLRERFSESSPTIRYGGSRAKGTMNRESYDLDLICYFPHDDTSAGESLEDIYNNVKQALGEGYIVESKTSALRLRSKEATTLWKSLQIDVVPGRFTDDSKSDCFLHQESGDKARLKTNLQIHIDHVKTSGVVEAIRLLKLWKVRKALRVKQFAFELLVIELLKKEKSADLSDQLEYFWSAIAESEEPIAIEDPANPQGNDLMPMLQGPIWQELKTEAARTLNLIDESGWETVFGKVEEPRRSDRITRLASASASVAQPTKPYGSITG